MRDIGGLYNFSGYAFGGAMSLESFTHQALNGGLMLLQRPLAEVLEEALDHFVPEQVLEQQTKFLGLAFVRPMPVVRQERGECQDRLEEIGRLLAQMSSAELIEACCYRAFAANNMDAKEFV